MEQEEQEEQEGQVEQEEKEKEEQDEQVVQKKQKNRRHSKRKQFVIDILPDTYEQGQKQAQRHKDIVIYKLKWPVD